MTFEDLHHGDGGPRQSVVAARRADPARRQHRRSMRLLVATLLALAGAAVAIPLVGSSAPDASAAVLAAVDSTMSQRTSDVSVHVAISAAGQSATLSGTGQVDYGAHAMSLDVALPGAAGTLRELVVGTTLYEQVPGVSSTVPGKSWVSLDLASLGIGAAGTSPASAWSAAANPLAILPLLEQQGGTVQTLGAGSVGGRTVRGYRVTFGRTALAARLAKLPSNLRPMASLVDLGGLTLQVEVTSTGLLASMGMTMSGSVVQHAFTGSVTLDFSTFGTAVTLSPPPATQVVTFQQFTGAAGGVMPSPT